MNRWMANEAMRLSRRNASVMTRVAQAWCRWLASDQPASVFGVSKNM